MYSNIPPSRRRITEQLIVYWNELRSNRAFPSFDDLSPAGIEDLWPDCFLMIIGNPEYVDDFEFLYMGQSVVELFGEEINTPKVLPFAEKVLSRYRDVALHKTAITEEGTFENMRGKMIKYRQVLLPLGRDDETVTHILGGIRSKTEVLDEQ